MSDYVKVESNKDTSKKFTNTKKSSSQNNNTFKGFSKLIIAAMVILVVIILISSSTYVVKEGQQAVLYSFGVMKEIIVSPENTFVDEYAMHMDSENSALKDVKVIKAKGLRFKMPFITSVNKYNSKKMVYLSESSKVNTREKKQFYVTMYANWSIENPGLFAVAFPDVNSANRYLDSLIYPFIVQKINMLSANDFISNKDVLDLQMQSGIGSLNNTISLSGILITDIQIYRTTLPSANIDSTFERMKADRAKVAQQYRSEGIESYQNSVAAADKEARLIEAQSIEEAATIRAEGQSEALRIYAEAYTKDEEFYEFWRSLQALENSLEGSTIILDKNSQLWSDLLEAIENNPSDF